MQIEAIYNKGRIELPPHLHLKYDVFKVRIEIPEYAYSEKGSDPFSPSTHQKIKNIFKYHGLQRESALSAPEDYKQIWHEHLEEKYIGK